jgi:hypothetical protein
MAIYLGSKTVSKPAAWFSTATAAIAFCASGCREMRPVSVSIRGRGGKNARELHGLCQCRELLELPIQAILLVLVIGAMESVHAAPMYWMYWGDKPGVYRSYLDGTHKELLLPNTPAVMNCYIDVDPFEKKIYIRGAAQDESNRFIRRCNLDGSNVEDVIVSSDLGVITYGFALDLRNHTMYIQAHAATPWPPGGMQMANMDGTGLHWLPSSIRPYYAHDIEVDTANSKLYYTDAVSYNGIRRANLDGTGREDVVNFGAGDIDSTHLALNVADGELYFTQYGSRTIRKATLDGSHQQILVNDIDAFDIEIDVSVHSPD